MAQNDIFTNKNAFYWDAYYPLLGRVSACQGVCLPKGGVCLGGVCQPEGAVSANGMSACQWGCQPRGVPAQGSECLPSREVSPLWTEWQTCVKALTCRNYVADGNKCCLVADSNTIRSCINQPAFQQLVTQLPEVNLEVIFHNPDLPLTT